MTNDVVGSRLADQLLATALGRPLGGTACLVQVQCGEEHSLFLEIPRSLLKKSEDVFQDQKYLVRMRLSLRN